LVGLPKALVPVGGKPLLDYWLESFERSGVAPVYVICNARHYDHFKRWAEGRGFPLANLLNDGTVCNEERKGAIGALGWAMQVCIGFISHPNYLFIDFRPSRPRR
jgi:NDP-sugar pyrophosphorylase family protein